MEEVMMIVDWLIVGKLKCEDDMKLLLVVED